MNAYIVQPCFQFIRIAGKASADAKVTVKATANGVSRTYEPVRDGEDFAIDIPVDVSRGKWPPTSRSMRCALTHSRTWTSTGGSPDAIR